MHTEEEVLLREQYPLIGKLLDNFETLYASLSAVDGGLNVLSAHEKELEAYVEHGAGDRSSPVIQWFEGNLDKNFHYNERNNELLVEAFVEEAKALNQSRSSACQPLAEQIGSATARAQAVSDEDLRHRPTCPREGSHAEPSRQ